jgi:hypothetical protein
MTKRNTPYTNSEFNEALLAGERNVVLIGNYISSNIKSEFKCVEGHVWNATPKSVLRGSGCPVCAGKLPLSKEIVAERLLKDGRSLSIIGWGGNGKIKTDFECFEGHTWQARPDSVLGGSGCPECTNTKFTKEIINAKLESRGIKIDEYKNALSHSTFRCSKNHTWVTKPSVVLGGSGCPTCADYGFSPDKPAWIYVLIFSNFIKYGITNNLKSRFRTHLLKNGKFKVAKIKSYDNGHCAKTLENQIKKIFGGHYATKEQCPDGYTETLSIDKLHLLLETIQ